MSYLSGLKVMRADLTFNLFYDINDIIIKIFNLPLNFFFNLLSLLSLL